MGKPEFFFDAIGKDKLRQFLARASSETDQRKMWLRGYIHDTLADKESAASMIVLLSDLCDVANGDGSDESIAVLDEYSNRSEVIRFLSRLAISIIPGVIAEVYDERDNPPE